MYTKYLIIGAGISGLAIAKALKKDFLILEADSRIGGMCKSIKKGDFCWDYGGHFLHFKDETIFNELKPFLDSNHCLKVVKNTKIFFKDSFIDFPFQHNIIQLSSEDFAKCKKDYLIANKIKSNNFKENIINQFGESICNFFLIPYNQKLYACDLETLDVDAMGRFFPSGPIDLNGKKTVSYNDSFYFCKYGIEDFILSFASSIDKTKIIFNTSVISVDLNKKVVYTNNGDAISYEYLINTIPFPTFTSLCGISLKNDFTYNQVIVLNLGFENASPIKKYHWVYFPQNNLTFYRVGFYNNIAGKEKESLYVECGFKSKENVDFDNLKKQVINQLLSIGFIDSMPIESEIISMDPAYVHLTKDSIDESNLIFDFLSKQNVFSIGRYGGWKYCSIEDCILDGYNLARKIKNE